MGKKLDLTGFTFGRLTALHPVENTKYRKWVCRCSCGNTKEILQVSLRNGNTRSCGCYRKEHQAKQAYKHGGFGSRLYKIWDGIKQRTTCPTSTSWGNYGGRGITLYSAWLDFSTFEQWALTNGYLPSLSIDRIDNNKGYSPDNCRWANSVTQGRNQRKQKNTSTKYIGVCLKKHPSGTVRYQASIRINGKRIYLGNYVTAIEAAIARDSFILKEGLSDFTMNGVL